MGGILILIGYIDDIHLTGSYETNICRLNNYIHQNWWHMIMRKISNSLCLSSHISSASTLSIKGDILVTSNCKPESSLLVSLSPKLGTQNSMMLDDSK